MNTELVGSESMLVMAEAGRAVVFDVHTKHSTRRGEGHRVLFIKTRHSRSFRYRNDGGCLEAGGNALLQDVKNDSNNISLLNGTCF